MAAGRITKRTVDALQATGKDYVHWDGELTGFGVRVRPSGSKSFVAVYRTGGRNTPLRRVTIGSVGKIEADKARNEAKAIINQAELGQDRAAEKAKLRAEMTFAKVCDLYLQEGCETKKTSTIATDRGRIERHIKPLLGMKRIGEISRTDVEKFMRDVAKGKTAADEKTKRHGRAIVEGGKGTATRTVGLLGGIMTFAVSRQLRVDNPVRGVKRYADKKGETFLSPTELGKVGAALTAIEAEGANPSAVAIIRLLAFTGARKSEIAALRWSEVDLERGYLRLGDSKTGAKVIPIGAPACEVLAGVAVIEGSTFVFPAAKGDSHFQGVEKIWRSVRTIAGFPDLRLHDLRHSFASVGLARGDALPVIGAILGHADVKTTSRYAHLADDPVKVAADAISKSVQAAFASNPSAEVIALGRTRKKN
ncbi:site-specific integrase [Mesorhizobium sp. PAMC28654]|uniref:tyrosine-type recombinase/integrase n=1 Tax=Mesorhizobium sp. PAMC28654 TaxID=2880934 RepID=UPI001D0BDA30|nr:site-specific integrase [Mesorhizobium sp. PAMC28654]UDL87220.1 site-specific integrase [Mesorhizobium sp. PAMC28654]